MLGENARLDRFHHLGFVVFDVVVPQEVKNSVHGHQCHLGIRVVVVLYGTCCNDLGCDEDVTEHEWRTIRVDRGRDARNEGFEGERQNIGGLILPEGLGVVTAHDLGADRVDTDLDPFGIVLVDQDVADQNVERAVRGRA